MLSFKQFYKKKKYEQVLEVFRKLTNQDIERLKQLYTDALTGKEDLKYTRAPELANTFNVGQGTIKRYLKQLSSRSNLTHGKRLTPWGVDNTGTKFPPGQIEYTKKLLKVREESRFHNPDDPNPPSEPFAYSPITVGIMINNMIDKGQALEQKDGRYWKKFTINNHPNALYSGQSCGSVARIGKKVEQELGYKRLEVGVRMSDNRVTFRGKTDKAGTRQKSFGPLGTNDPSYISVMGRAQAINDQDYQVK